MLTFLHYEFHVITLVVCILQTNQGAALTYDYLHRNLHIEVPKDFNRYG